MLEELIPIILEVMIDYKSPIKIEKIIEISSYERGEITKGINTLCDLGIAFKIKDEKGVVTYQLLQNLKGLHVAKAAQVGVDLGAFENFFKIDPKEKSIALEIATNAEKIKQLDISKRKPLLQKRVYFVQPKNDDIYETLMVLFEASNTSLYEYIEKLAQKDDYLKLLISMHMQSEKSLREYSENLR